MAFAMNSSTEHLAPLADPRWSASTSPSMTPEPEKQSTWARPPIPPIPDEHYEEEAWRRRSSKRQSLTKRMSGGPGLQPLGADSEKKTTRPVSEISTTSTVDVRRGRAGKRKSAEPDVYGQLHWEINARNPRNWSKRKKWTHAIMSSAMMFTVAFATSGIALGRTKLVHDFDASSTIAILPISLFIFGLPFGPFLSRACSGAMGRKLTYVVFMPLFAALTLGVGFVDSAAGIIACRFFAGLFAGPALSLGYGVICDIWAAEERGISLAIYYTMVFLGPVVGMVVDGYVVQDMSWRWTQWVILFAIAGCIAAVVLMSETSTSIILRRQGKAPPASQASGNNVSKELQRLVLALPTRPAVLLLSLHSAFNVAVLYASFVAFPRIFSTAYGFRLGLQGLTFLSMIVGLVLGFAVLMLHHRFIYQPRVDQWEAQQAAEAEKARRRTNRSSRASYNSHRSYASNFSRPPIQRNQSSHTSLSLALKRISAGRPATRGEEAPPVPTVVDMERNTSLAAAAADYLNGLDVNEGKRILPERVMLVLNGNPAFGDLCAALESYGLRMDRVQFAKVLVDALPATVPGTSDGPIAHPEPSALISSKTLHRNAAAAALNIPAASPPPSLSRQLTYRGQTPRPLSEVKVQPSPAEWRLWAALPASVLLPASLFLFGWTAGEKVHWIAPCIGMAIFAFSALLVFLPTQLYVGDRCKPESSGALAGDTVLRYLMSFAFTLFAIPMYDRLGTAWATSLLGFIALLLGTVPWVLVFSRSGKAH